MLIKKNALGGIANSVDSALNGQELGENQESKLLTQLVSLVGKISEIL